MGSNATVLSVLSYLGGVGLILLAVYTPVPLTTQSALFGIGVFMLGHATGYSGRG